MTINDLVIQLSYKIGDPTPDGGDGEIFALNLKIGYLQRAYSKLMRTLPMLMRRYAPRFTKTVFVHSQDINGTSVFNIVINGKTQWIEKIYDMFVTYTDDKIQKKVKAIYKEPIEYLSIKYDTNPTVASLDDGIIFYTIINNKVRLLPEYSDKNPYIVADIILDKNTTESFDTSDIILVPTEYIDLLITIAASEAMQDIGRQDKVNLYNSEISGHYSILSNYSQMKEKYEGSDING